MTNAGVENAPNSLQMSKGKPWRAPFRMSAAWQAVDLIILPEQNPFNTPASEIAGRS